MDDELFNKVKELSRSELDKTELVGWQFLKLYRAVLSGSSLHRVEPFSFVWHRGVELLEENDCFDFSRFSGWLKEEVAEWHDRKLSEFDLNALMLEEKEERERLGKSLRKSLNL